jgi:hypothetical protein
LSVPILNTKLYIPPPQPSVVLRPRLIERLGEGMHRRLIPVCAPAGFGETTLLGGLAGLGLIGGPVLVAAAVAVLFGAFEAGSVWQIIATMLEFFCELSLGIWLIVKGFNPTAAILSGHEQSCPERMAGEKSLVRA